MSDIIPGTWQALSNINSIHLFLIPLPLALPPTTTYESTSLNPHLPSSWSCSALPLVLGSKMQREAHERLDAQPEKKTVEESKNPAEVRRGGNDFMCSKNPAHVADIKSHQTKPCWNSHWALLLQRPTPPNIYSAGWFGDTAVGNR